MRQRMLKNLLRLQVNVILIPSWKSNGFFQKRAFLHHPAASGLGSTLHAVKGLEYDNVYIMNVNEGSMPYRKAVLEAHLEEERRLFYVGMTRAKKKLCLYYVRQQYEKEREPSRFLEEAGL